MKRVRIYAGIVYDRDGTPLPGYVGSTGLETIKSEGVRNFGGITIYYHDGCWKDNGKWVAEAGRTFEFLGDIPLIDAQEFAVLVRETFHQKSVVLTIEDVDVEFV